MHSLRFRHLMAQLLSATAIAVAATSAPALADEATGITDSEIKIGGICPSTGPIASFVTICAMQDAYFKSVNEHDGGVMMSDGKRRKIAYTYYDDGYSPPRTVEQARRLVERDNVALVIGPLGSATGLAIRNYLNRKDVPQLFVGSGLSAFSTESDKYPWTVGWQPSYTTEGSIYAEFVKSKKPDAKVAVLYQNDDFGKELLNAFKAASAGSGVTIADAQSYEVTSPTVDSQVSNLGATNADVLLVFAVPKFTAQTLRKVQDMTWRPTVIVSNISASRKTVMEPAGAEASEGVYSVVSMMDPTTSDYAATKDMEVYRAIGSKFPSSGLNLDDPMTMYGFSQAQTMVAVLQKAKAPTREAIMESARSLCDVAVLGVVPGVKVCVNGKQDPFYVETMQVVRYSKGNWQKVGEVISKYEGKTPQSVK
ncbi:ABC transporter substrate-binding protein [Bradyrhizobium sp. RD5-C2]|uniref:ABC transporter substrate-binding protein n=1 Tax=Bradyrhizobium sp. RD5-C2 TaxID=244562 RepID=UPI001CC662A8|nr:ABC transporter substrate-binding protein [Bradyrhizobium sp. RD5-C2]GIQ76927.1 branched-chain amino acid ABC transporter substrate-binding protein [Bradyrhizobium sp. RD5-C2]